MAPAVHGEVAEYAAGATGQGRDHGGCAAIVQLGADPVDVERLVGDERVEGEAADQWLDSDAVAPLTRKQDETGEVAQCVDQDNDLGGQAAPRSADRLMLNPPFAPVPCRWT